METYQPQLKKTYLLTCTPDKDYVNKSMYDMQLTLVISTSLISNKSLSWSENMIPVLEGNLITGNTYGGKEEKLLQKQFLLFSTIFSIYI